MIAHPDELGDDRATTLPEVDARIGPNDKTAQINPRINARPDEDFNLEEVQHLSPGSPLGGYPGSAGPAWMPTPKGLHNMAP